MDSRISRLAWRILVTSALLSVFAAGLMAQRRGTQRAVEVEDEDFNSPTPILLSEADSTRAIAQPTLNESDVLAFPSKTEPRAFALNSKVVLYVTNLSLLEGEGANAFRVYGVDKRGHTYRFPVLGMQPDTQTKGVFALTTLLTDEVGYFAPPQADGDILVYVTWRGLESNRTRLGLGKVGGEIKEAETAKPTPLGTTAEQLAPQIVAGPPRGGDRHRFLQQATFGPTRDFTTQFNRTRLQTWIRNQFNAPYPSASNPYPNQPLKPFFAPADCDNDQGTTPDVPVTCFRDTYTMYPVQTWNSLEMMYGSNQLRHKIAWALSQIWVTSGNTIQQSRHMVEWHKILSNNAFGNYKDIMRQMTLHPTMGSYLSMAGSTRITPNENYAREIEQLFTIGLFMMNQDGTYQCVEHNPCQPGDTKIPTYDQNQINNLTRVFTGWNLCTVAGASCPNHVANTNNYIDPMLLNRGVTTGANNRHDIHAKTLLVYPGSTTTNVAACPATGTGGCGITCPTSGTAGCTLQAGFTNAQALAAVQTYANNSLEQAMTNIFNHPNVGPFVSRILIQQLVTSDPTPAYVGRVSAAFNNNGSGVRGDMKAVIMAVLLDPEARGDYKTDANYGKLREPVSYFYGILRALNVRNAAGTGPSDGVFLSPNFNLGNYTGMGQNPFIAPTVFNYYPPSYIVPGTNLNGPEFALMTTGTTIQRANMINRIAGINTNGNMPTPPAPPLVAAATTHPDVPVGTSIDISDLQALVTADQTGGLLLDELDKRFMHYRMPTAMRTSILNALTPISNTDTTNAKVRQSLYLVLTSSQYQVQR